MEQIGKTVVKTRFIPMYFEETEESNKAKAFRDLTGKEINFSTFKKAEKFLTDRTNIGMVAIGKSVEHITIYF